MSSLVQIKTLAQLGKFLPMLRVLYEEELHKYWTADTWPNLCEQLIQSFAEGDYFFGKIQDSEILYFISIKEMDSEHAHFWLLYANTKFRDKTKQVVLKSLDSLKEKGYHKVTFTTKRMTSSYDRWVTKNFNAKLTSKTYQIDL